MTRRQTGSHGSHGSQIPLSTGYQWVSECRSDRPSDPTGELVLTGSRTYDRTGAVDWYHPPLQGVGTSHGGSQVRLPRRRISASTRLCEGADVKELRAALLPLLPLRATLCCQPDAGSVLCAVTTSRAVWKALRRLRRVVFGVDEWTALVSSFEVGRNSPYDLLRWCEDKLVTPSFKVSERDTIGELAQRRRQVHRYERERCDATVGAVLAGWGLELASVSYGDEVPSC